MNIRAKAMSLFLLGLIRALTGAQARWQDFGGVDYFDTRNVLVAWPPLVVAVAAGLGARRAARGLLGKTVSISKARGMPHTLEDGSELWVTAHPSYLLRLDGEAKEQQERLFQADLAAVAERLAELAE